MLRNFGMIVGVLAVGFGLGVYVGEVRLDAQRSARVLEVRRYTANAGKLDALVKRMREGESQLFEKHGMRSVLYSTATDAPDAQNIFLYILSHENREASKKSWENFRNDPVWKSLRESSEVNGSLVGKVESAFYSPADFSPIQ